MSELDGYRVGGTVHIIVNNQVGFTTSPRDAKSTTYATDVARMLQIPIFHVNGEDPEAVSQVVDLAVDFRQRFHRDAIIELWCYRKLGHNEGDEPSYTQPVMYRTIAAKPSIRMAYLAYDTANPTPGGEAPITVEETDADRRGQAARAGGAAGDRDARRSRRRGRARSRARGPASRAARTSQVPEVPTAATPAEIQEVTRAISTMPADFHVHPKLKSGRRRRRAPRWAPAKSRSTGGWARRSAFGTLLARGDARAPVGAGFAPRHVQPPALRAARLQRRPRVHAARAHPRQAGDVRGARQPAVGGRRAGLRLRLQPGHAGGAHDLGGAVRRLRERGAGDHRSVPLLVGGEVAPRERPGDAAAARHGGAGARALERAARSLPEPVRQRQHAGLQPDDAGAVLPRAAAAGAAALPQAARSSCRPRACCGRRPRRRRWRISPADRSGTSSPTTAAASRTARSEEDQARAAVHGQGLLRSRRHPRGTRLR